MMNRLPIYTLYTPIYPILPYIPYAPLPPSITLQPYCMHANYDLRSRRNLLQALLPLNVMLTY